MKIKTTKTEKRKNKTTKTENGQKKIRVQIKIFFPFNRQKNTGEQQQEIEMFNVYLPKL